MKYGQLPQINILEGTFPPCITYDITKAVKSMHGMMVAHAKAVCAYKEKKVTKAKLESFIH